MTLSANQVRLLELTSRKSDCDFKISMDSMKKMALTREQNELSREYYAKLQSKKLSYYNNGHYSNVNYAYLMGTANQAYAICINAGVKNSPVGSSQVSSLTPVSQTATKSDNSVVLTDSNGLVVISDEYCRAIKSVIGDPRDAYGRAGTFDTTKIPEMIYNFLGKKSIGSTPVSVENIETIIKGGYIEGLTEYNYFTGSTALDGTKTGNTQTKTGSNDAINEGLKAVVNYYYPVFLAAATNGWTTEYNKELAEAEKSGSSYLGDAIASGIFRLESIMSNGDYEPDTSLSYFATKGLVTERTDADVREEVTAWYNAEKEAINEKEQWIDMELQDLSTELEAINAEIESVKSYIQDGMGVFEWDS